ncbi:T9SS type A sorting domain-containing protein [Flavobacterium hungaricum]|uniref:T9SS C-terminal target domain-containing protein n=1 Tax=Flavobacterium hungaricum TaxID=2082725 RepID=A0ABR9TJ21_9FLAO|nr:T9SS type A sorting domain-containing protein [Flavobacterium hungaricum]MBE8725029.1 T9SS C-terminal target domain-containing protein [Flavobacterium hungaricum]
MRAKLLLLLFLANFSTYAQTNLVTNGDFENWTSSSQPDNWFRNFNGLIYQSLDAQKGNSSTKMEITSGNFNYINSESFSLQPGKTYRITLYQKLVSGTFSSIELNLTKTDAFKTTIQKIADANSVTSEWRKIEFDYVSTISQNAEISVWITGSINSQILIDNISVVDIAEINPQYTILPDINFENKLIALGIDSGVPDGKVLTSKINTITEIDLYFSNISDLTGIQDFKALKSLSVMSNKLTTIDISQNLDLTYLNVAYNKLTTINTSKNTALQYLSLFYNEITSLDLSQNLNLLLLSCKSNKLTNIDVSNNKKLSTLWCPLNELINLDVSKNTALTSIQCSENKVLTRVNLRNGNNSRILLNLNNIDFKNNPALTCILVDDALFSNEKWQSFKDPSASYSTVDCSQVTPIPDSVFEDKLIALNIDTDGKNGSVLNSSIANITSLDVSSSLIKDLTGIQGFTALNYLDTSNNKLSALDLSQNKNLTLVNCSQNSLSNLNLKNGNNSYFDLNSNFKSNPDLKCIQVDDETYAADNWTALKDITANYNVDCTPYTLIPDSNFEDKLIALEIDKDGKNGKVATSSVKSITYLDVTSSNIADMTGIEDFVSLTYLDLNYNKVTAIDVSKNILLTKLALHDNNVTSLDVTKNTQLVNLMCSKNQIKSIDLSQNKNLLFVTIDENKLTEIDFSENIKLESIYCGNTNLSTIDVSNLPNLKDLNCTYTNISTLNVRSNPKLENLYFNNAKLTTIDLSNNPLLKRLNISNNELTEVDLSKNPLLELIFIEFNPLTALNVQNGNNKNFILPSVTGKTTASGTATSFLNNSKLKCIKVDNVAYSNANWSKIKESTTTYSETCTLGLEESIFEKVVIYPNPTKDVLNIQNANLEKVNIYNVLGQLVKSFKLNSDNTVHTINLSELPKGVYYVYLISQDAASAKKVIVE